MADPTPEGEAIAAVTAFKAAKAFTPQEDLVWKLKVQGSSPETIAAVTKLSVEEVVNTIERKAQQRRMSIAQTFDVEVILSVERLDAMFEALWDRVSAGEVNAIKTARELDESRRKLLGLDAEKTKAAFAVDIGGDVDMTKLSAEELKEYLRLTKKMAKVSDVVVVSDVTPEE